MTALPAIYDEKFTRGLLINRRMKPNPLRLVHPALGITFPFHPALWGDNLINETLAGAKELVHTLLKEKYSREEYRKMLIRVDNIFDKLDFNTHRKSIAIILNPDEEKITYLDFPVKPAVITGKEVLLFDLIAGIEEKEEFYLLVVENGRKSLHEYNGSQLSKVYEQPDVEDAADLYKKTYKVIEMLNGKNEKPVFVTGLPNLVELFCSNPAWSKIMFTILYDYNSFDNGTLKSFVNEITSHWSYWHAKFITGKMLIAQRTGSLITNIEAVTAALTKKADGLLMISKFFIKRLKETERLNGNIKIKNSFLQEVENFLARGNRVLFTEEGSVKNAGAVVLLSHRSNSGQNVIPYAKTKNKTAVRIDF